MFSEGTPEPPKNRTRTMIIAGLSLVIVVGLVMVVVLLVRGDDTPPAASPTTTASGTTGATRSGSPTGSSGASGASWVPITNADAGMTYEVPASWTRSKSGTRSTSGPILSGLAALHPYQCGQGEYTRAEVGSGKSDDTDMARAARELAKYVATKGYSVDKAEPKVTLEEPSNFTNGGVAGVMVVANATTTAASECNAPKGKVVALAMRGPRFTGMFVLDVSFEGKNAQYAPTEAEMKRILDSVRLAK